MKRKATTILTTTDGGGGGHRVLEEAVPLAEDEVTADQYALALIAFREEGK
jgi:hypothetical protein